MSGFEIGKLTEDDFVKEETSKQLWYLYKGQEHTQETQEKILSQCSCRMEQCKLASEEKDKEYDKRFTKIEKSKKFDTALGTASGGIGGFLAFILQKFLNL